MKVVKWFFTIVGWWWNSFTAVFSFKLLLHFSCGDVGRFLHPHSPLYNCLVGGFVTLWTCNRIFFYGVTIVGGPDLSLFILILLWCLYWIRCHWFGLSMRTFTKLFFIFSLWPMVEGDLIEWSNWRRIIKTRSLWGRWIFFDCGRTFEQSLSLYLFRCERVSFNGYKSCRFH